MQRNEFMALLKAEIDRAESKKGENNVLDLRGFRFPQESWKDEWIGNITALEDAWEFVKDAEEWYIDIYENLHEEEYAVFTDCAVCSY